MRSRIAGSSSMTSTVAAPSGDAAAGALVDAAGATLAGSLIVKVLPRPGSLSTVTSPPINRQSRRESARPRPVPP
jgi:hypothetical protein